LKRVDNIAALSKGLRKTCSYEQWMILYQSRNANRDPLFQREFANQRPYPIERRLVIGVEKIGASQELLRPFVGFKPTGFVAAVAERPIRRLAATA
jgi:hypothetical protein